MAHWNYPPPQRSDWWKIIGFLALFALTLWLLGTYLLDECYGPPDRVPKECLETK